MSIVVNPSWVRSLHDPNHGLPVNCKIVQLHNTRNCRSSEPDACYTIHIGRLVTCESDLKCLFGLNSLHKFRDFCWFFAAELMRGGGRIEGGRGWGWKDEKNYILIPISQLNRFIYSSSFISVSELPTSIFRLPY